MKETPGAPAPSTGPEPEEPTPVEAVPNPDDEPEPEPSSPEAAKCIQTSKLAHCLPLFGPSLDDETSMSTGAECTRSCIGKRSERLKPIIERAKKACVDTYAKNKAKPPKCLFPQFPEPKDPRELSMRFQDALRAAVEKKDDASIRALEKMLERLDAKHLARAEPTCSSRCKEEGAQLK